MADANPYRATPPLTSVSNAVEMLKAFGRQGEWGVTELARELGLGKSATHRLLQTLTAGGLVEQVSDRGTYVLGMELVRIARAAARRTTLGAVAHRHLESLSHRAEDAALLTVLRNHRYICTDVVNVTRHIVSVVQLGDTVGLHAGAGGKAILAFQPPWFRDEVLAEPLVRYTDQTICDPAVLQAELEAVRQSGVAYSDSEVTPGSASVAVPIRDAEGRVIASVNVTTSSFRMREVGLDHYRRLVRGAASDISADLGYRGTATPGQGRRTP
ncbi:IclR family transcriptional regulator [Plantactinospora sp. GCM10030261]|uniref:IclR family transcriptional regulator n=1 Tax=Plantactinospora sp. GCM10030261 TaxID=3273420 RepID=UPI003621AA61